MEGDRTGRKTLTEDFKNYQNAQIWWWYTPTDILLQKRNRDCNIEIIQKRSACTWDNKNCNNLHTWAREKGAPFWLQHSLCGHKDILICTIVSCSGLLLSSSTGFWVPLVIDSLQIGSYRRLSTSQTWWWTDLHQSFLVLVLILSSSTGFWAPSSDWHSLARGKLEKNFNISKYGGVTDLHQIFMVPVSISTSSTGFQAPSEWSTLSCKRKL